MQFPIRKLLLFRKEVNLSFNVTEKMFPDLQSKSLLLQSVSAPLNFFFLVVDRDFFFFDVDHFFKVFIEFVTVLLPFYVLFLWP